MNKPKPGQTVCEHGNPEPLTCTNCFPRNKLQDLKKLQDDTNIEIERALEELPEWGGECTCDEVEGTIDLTIDGVYCPEVQTHCTTCGGVLDY